MTIDERLASIPGRKFLPIWLLTIFFALPLVTAVLFVAGTQLIYPEGYHFSDQQLLTQFVVAIRATLSVVIWLILPVVMFILTITALAVWVDLQES